MIDRMTPAAFDAMLEERMLEHEAENEHREGEALSVLRESIEGWVKEDGPTRVVLPDGDIILVDPNAPDVRRVTIYVHRDKESNWTTWMDELGQPENDAGREFSYALLEVALECEVNIDTGDVKIIGIRHGDAVIELPEAVPS